MPNCIGGPLGLLSSRKSDPSHQVVLRVELHLPRSVLIAVLHKPDLRSWVG